MKQNKMFIMQRIRSFGFALNGFIILVSEEHNARIHIISAMVAIILGCALKISLLEWIAVCFAIGFVLTCEIINSAIENLADFVSSEKHYLIKKVKDLSAFGVLVSALTALIIGIIVFLPKFLSLCSAH